MSSALIAHAQSLVFPNFTSTTGLTINSAATATTSDGKVLLLADNVHNDRGSVFATNLRNVAAFSTSFQFRVSNPNGQSDSFRAGGDGFAFVIQRAAPTALGGNGEYLGYGGTGSGNSIPIGQSIAVEFDTFKNPSQNDVSTNHLGINFGGSVQSLASLNVAQNFDDANLWTAWIDYDGTTLQIRANSTGVRPGSALFSFNLSLSDLNTALGGTTAYVGFTSSTGGAYADHTLVNWTFADSYISGGVTAGSAIPEPSTWATLAGALMLGVAATRRRWAKRS